MADTIPVTRTKLPNAPPVLEPGEIGVDLATPQQLWVGVSPTVDPSGKVMLAESGGGSGGVAEAPIDTTPYARQDAGWVPALSSAGGTMTGPLEVPPIPTEDSQAASKYYVDSRLGDEFWEYTIFLLRGDGAHGDSNFVDDRGRTITIENGGGVTHDTATVKMGTGAIAFTGVGNLAVAVPASVNEHWTLEAWVMANDWTNVPLFDLREAASQQLLCYVSNGTVAVKYGLSDFVVPGTTVLQPGVWYHLTFMYHSRMATTQGTLATGFYVFIDGVQDLFTDLTFTYGNDVVRLGGEYTAATFATCWMDDIRFSHMNRYDANFEPPPGPLPGEGMQPPLATVAVPGTVVLADNTDVWQGTTDAVITAQSIQESNTFRLFNSSGGAVDIAWTQFHNGEIIADQDIIINGPTLAYPGTVRRLWLKGIDATPRTVTFGPTYSQVPIINDLTDTKTYLLTLTCLSVQDYLIETEVVLGTAAAGGGGIGEAPVDGTPYSRQDAAWVAAAAGGGSDPAKLDIAGGTMTGPLMLAADPLSDLEAATRQYVARGFAGDEYWGDVEILVQANGTHGEVPINEKSGYAVTVIGTGVILDTTMKKHGSGSMGFDGLGHATVNCDQPGLGDWTVEGHVNVPGPWGAELTLVDFRAAVPHLHARVFFSTTGEFSVTVNSITYKIPGAKALGSWLAFAVVRSGARLSLYCGAAMPTVFEDADTLDYNNPTVVIGGSCDSTGRGVCWIDDFRYTRFARYSGPVSGLGSQPSLTGGYGAPGIPDAPADGQIFGRKDNSWASVSVHDRPDAVYYFSRGKQHVFSQGGWSDPTPATVVSIDSLGLKVMVEPTDPQHAATKNYVDTSALALDALEARVAALEAYIASLT